MTVIDLNNCPGIIQAVEHIYVDGDPVRTMLILTELTDLGLKHGLADESDRSLLNQVHQILAEIAILREKNGN